MRKAVFATALLSLLAVGLLAVACGGSGEGSKTPTVKVSPIVITGTVSMEADDFSFDPHKLATDMGKTVTVKIKNGGKTQHTFTINEFNVDQTLRPDEEKIITFTPDRSGDFTFYCRFHRNLGMSGSLSVVSSSGETSGGTSPTPSSSPSAGGEGGIGGY